MKIETVTEDGIKTNALARRALCGVRRCQRESKTPTAIAAMIIQKKVSVSIRRRTTAPSTIILAMTSCSLERNFHNLNMSFSSVELYRLAGILRFLG